MLTKGQCQKRRILIIKCDLFCGYQSASFPNHTYHCPMDSWTKWPWWQGGRLCMGSSRPAWLWPMLSAWSASSRDQYWAPIWHHSPGDWLVTWWEVYYIWYPFYHGRRSVLSLLEQTHILYVDLPSLRLSSATECFPQVLVKLAYIQLPQYTPQVLSLLGTFAHVVLSLWNILFPAVIASSCSFFRCQLIYHLPKDPFHDHTIKITYLLSSNLFI